MAQETAMKRELTRKGWSYRRAAPILGVSPAYLCRCANGIYNSKRLKLKVLQMPYAPKPARRRRAK